MKYCLVIAIWFASLTMSAQKHDDCERNQENSVRTQLATDLLNDCITDINELNTGIGTCLAVGVKSNELGAYANRLASAEKILSRLEVVDHKFTCLTEDNPGEADYFVKDAYTKITELSIIARRSDYLDFLRISNSLSADLRRQLPYADAERAYVDKYKDWSLREEKLKRETKSLLRKIQDIDATNGESPVLKAILGYYEGATTTESDFNSLITKLKMHAAKHNTIDPHLGFAESWLAYIKISKRKFGQAQSLVDSIRTLSDPERSITWAEQASICLDAKLTNGSSIFPIGYNLPEEKAHFTRYTLKYLKEYANKKIGPGFQLTDEEVRIYNLQPQLLIAQLQLDWSKLLELENEVLTRAQKALNYANGFKNLNKGLISAFKNADTYYYVKFSDLTKKKDILNQSILYSNRFDKALPVVQDFISERKAWSSLVNENSNELFYREMRIKTDLALVYIKQHQQSFTGFLDYYKLNNKLIDDGDKNTINQIFAQSGLEAEIKDDLNACLKMDSTDIQSKISKIEEIAYSEESAKGLFDLGEFKKNLSPAANVNGVSAKSLITQAVAYLYLKGSFNSKVKGHLDDMADYANLDDAQKVMKIYYKYKEDEQNARNGKVSR